MEYQTTHMKRRGFASMDPARQRVIASHGGRAAQARGVAHRFTNEEAQAAGRKGGLTISQNREHMASIGRVGGKSRADHHDGTQHLRLLTHLNPSPPGDL